MRTLGALALLALLSPTQYASAWCQMTTNRERATGQQTCNEEGIPLSWRQRCLSFSLDYRAGSTIDLDTLREVTRTSFDTWLSVRCDGENVDFEVEETEELASCLPATHRDEGSANVISFREAWPSDYDETAFAVTTVWHSTRTGEILGADIELNEELGPFEVCPHEGCEDDETGRPTVDLQNVLTHEIGHFFGLAHSEFRGSTMDAVSPRGETTKRILRTDDIDGYCAVYPPQSLPTECDFTPSGGYDLNCEDDPTGCRAAPSGSGVWLLLMLLPLRRRRSAV